MTRETTTEPTRSAPAEDFSLLRVAAFLVRYRWLLLGLPAAGFLLAAGWTALASEPVHVASARVRSPASFDDAVAAAAARAGGGAGASLAVTRDSGVAEIRSSAPTDSAALGRLRSALAAARDSFADERSSASPPEDADGAAALPADSALDAAESTVAAYLEDHPGLAFQEAVRDPANLRGVPHATGRAAETQFELALRLARLDDARAAYGGEARSAARSGALGPEAAERRYRTLRDSIRSWLEGRREAALPAPELFRYEALLWRLSLWQQTERAARKAGGGGGPSLEVLSAPSMEEIRRADALGDGIVGLLLGALLGFGTSLFREALRRGRIRGDEDYEEFRDAVRGLSRLPGDGRGGGES